MSFTLRPYQEECVSKMLWAMTLNGNDLIVAGQGAGKSIIIAEFAHRLNQPVLIICPNKELTEQNINKMAHYMPREDIGVYSASLNEKTVKPITFGTIQSMYKNPENFRMFNVAIIDEADLHNPKRMDTMSNKLFRGANIKKVFGTTATPFRLGTSYRRWGHLKWQVESVTITQMINRHYPAFWNRILHVINVNELTNKGYLTPLLYHDVSLIKHNEIPTNKSKSEFDLIKFETIIDKRYPSIANYIKKLPYNKKLIFCSSVTQSEQLQTLLNDSIVVTALTDKKTREDAISLFRKASNSTLIGVGIFTAGFDVPDINCIISLRPTRSLRLWSQVIGRGTRLSEGKETCHIYDFVGNIRSLGTLESMEIKKLDNKWNVVTDTKPEGWHGEELYKFKLKAPKEEEDLS